MENYFSWKTEKKVGEFEKTLDLFIKTGMRIDNYVENYLTCCTDVEIAHNQNIPEMYLRIAVKYSFARVYNNANEHFLDSPMKKLTKKQYDLAVLEIEEQIKIQSDKMRGDKTMMKQQILELDLINSCSSDYSFLYWRILYWMNSRNQNLIVQNKSLMNNIY